jgi:iron complex transport system ATP-binding protein
VKLTADNLSFGYPGKTVGSQVSLTLDAGEAVCVLGPNGGGKTTLFRTLLGLLSPHAGEVRLEDKPLAQWSRVGLARSIAYVPQAHESLFAFTVEEVVLMGRTAHVGLFGSPSSEDRKMTGEAIEALGLAHLAEAVYTRISGGERQLTLIARAIAQGAQLIVLDEPTASLDFGNRARVLEMLAGIAERGLGVLFSTHHPDEAYACADRVLMLKAGKIIESGPSDAVINAHNLQTLYGVPVEIAEMREGAGRACLPVIRRSRAC